MIRLTIVHQSFDELRSCESVLVAAFGGIVVNLLNHLDGFVVLATEAVLLAQQHPCVVIVCPQFVLPTEVQHFGHHHHQRIMDIVIVVVSQLLILQSGLFAPVDGVVLRSVVRVCRLSTLLATTYYKCQ